MAKAGSEPRRGVARAASEEAGVGPEDSEDAAEVDAAEDEDASGASCGRPRSLA